MEWIHVSDRPLVIKVGEHAWETTEDGSGEFLAAVPYNDSTRPEEKDLWWIRHCVIEESGLCVVGDDDNESASWSAHNVEYWMPITNPKTSTE
jgi:hypothetical protein